MIDYQKHPSIIDNHIIHPRLLLIILYLLIRHLLLLHSFHLLLSLPENANNLTPFRVVHKMALTEQEFKEQFDNGMDT